MIVMLEECYPSVVAEEIADVHACDDANDEEAIALISHSDGPMDYKRVSGLAEWRGAMNEDL